MKGIRRTIGTAPKKKAPATAEIVGKMLATCSDTLIGKRDRALVAVGMAGAFRRSELIALTVDDIEHTKERILITIRRSKWGSRGTGTCRFVAARTSCPTGRGAHRLAGLRWDHRRCSVSHGCSGRQTGRGNEVARIVKKLIARAGLKRENFSAHSLRAGFLSSAAEHNASIWKMQEQSRHRSLDTLSGYGRSKTCFQQHAGSGFL